MKTGILVAPALPECLGDLGRGIEERGFHSVWLADQPFALDEPHSPHPYGANGRLPSPLAAGALEPFTSLAFLAACTRRLRLGLGVCVLPRRETVYVAQQAGSLDRLSKGRLDLGVGIGWAAEEFTAVGAHFAGRGRRLDAQVAALKRLWRDAGAPLDDDPGTASPGRLEPRPAQQPHPPLHVGGHCAAALRRVAALGDGWLGWCLTPGDAKERIAQLERMLAERDRRREDVVVSVSPFPQELEPDAVPRYRDAGVDQLILRVSACDRSGLLAELDALASQVEAAR